MISIKSLHIYPVKSLRGISLAEAELTAKGLAHDRQFMLVNSNGSFVTQRQNTKLALIDTSLTKEGIVLSRPGRGSLLLSLDEDGAAEVITTKVWADEVETLDCGDDASNWISAAVESTDALRVVRMAPGFVRPLKAKEALGHESTTDFADAAPFTLVSEASLTALNEVLNRKQQSSVRMNRFRPNIVVEGLLAFAEHELSILRGPGYEFQFRAHCQRCVVTTINQETAVKDPGGEPFKTLQEINPDPNKPTAPAFSHYVTLASASSAKIQVGDQLERTDTGTS